MYRYLDSESAETILGIRGLLMDDYEGVIKGNILHPHVTILGKGEIASKLFSATGSSVSIRRRHGLYNEISSHVFHRLHQHPTVEIVGSTILRNSMIAVEIMRPASYTTMDRVFAIEELSRYTGAIHDTTPHITIARTIPDIPATLQEELYEATEHYVHQYLDHAAVKLSPPTTIRHFAIADLIVKQETYYG